MDDACETVLERLREAREHVDRWSIEEEGIEPLIAGVKKTYKRGYHAMEQAAGGSDGVRFHEWRNRVKYHGYHCRLLVNVRPVVMNARIKEVSRLGDSHASVSSCVLSDRPAELYKQLTSLLRSGTDFAPSFLLVNPQNILFWSRRIYVPSWTTGRLSDK
ncbi:hypothetical protein EC9_42170 [Rosistilla ulvae]|uniref:Uncharacterized protein n=1 Tax=Rosistilla ulvae TaxID=1930277 RepID=A0A517M571_9BACT|nr:hypothetical protein [Rosistilla ulvae]QDS90014.1 hypothetical protein EC9_42170 [Rosistilla ulvae]